MRKVYVNLCKMKLVLSTKTNYDLKQKGMKDVMK